MHERPKHMLYFYRTLGSEMCAMPCGNTGLKSPLDAICLLIVGQLVIEDQYSRLVVRSCWKL